MKSFARSRSLHIVSPLTEPARPRQHSVRPESRKHRSPIAVTEGLAFQNLSIVNQPLPIGADSQAGRDLNPQPLVLETSALPVELPT